MLINFRSLCIKEGAHLEAYMYKRRCSFRSLYVAVTGRNSTVSGLIQLVISLECFIEITPDFECPFMNDRTTCTVNFRATATAFSYSCLNIYNFTYANVRFLYTCDCHICIKEGAHLEACSAL